MQVPGRYNIKEIIQAIRRSGGLVLFLGAGVNHGLAPLWDGFLKELWDYAVKIGLSPLDRGANTDRIASWVNASGIFSTYEKASLIKILLGEDRYLLAIRKILYGQKGEKFSPSLKSLIELCKTGKVKSVITFNYDVFLEEDLEKELTHRPGIPVQHVHGIVKDQFHTTSKGPGVVLSMEEYFHNMAMPLSWQTTVQLHALINNTCLFVGTSLTDINMLRLLTYARDQMRTGRVFALLAREEFKNKVIQEIARQPVSEKELGGSKKDDWVNEAIKFVIRSKVTLLNELGVSAFVVENFTDIPAWLKQLTGEVSLLGGEGDGKRN